MLSTITIPEQPLAQEVMNGCLGQFYGQCNKFTNITDH